MIFGLECSYLRDRNYSTLDGKRQYFAEYSLRADIVLGALLYTYGSNILD